MSLHSILINEFGGIHGVRDFNVLEYILEVPEHTLNQEYMYSSLIDKAAILAFLIITRHPFLDGNKRVGMFLLIIYMRYYGVIFKPTQKDVVAVALSIASHSLDYSEFLEWVHTHCG